LHCVQERVREKERVSKAVRKERKKILVDHFFLPILVDKKKRNKKASVLWRTNTTRKRILVRQKRRLCALAPIEPRSRPMSIGREPSSSREEEQRSLFTLSPSLFRARNTNTITTTTRKSTIPDRFSSIVIINSGSKSKRKRARRGDEGWSKKSFRRAPSRPRLGSWSVLRSVRTA
jgi:hypothetical protein